MERWQLWCMVGILGVAGIGCGKSQPSEAGGAAGANGVASGDSTPDLAVKEFLSAARSGDQKKLSLLLSKGAQQEAAKNNVNFELDSYQNATFEVGEFEYLTDTKDSAHVGCKWTDRDSDGSTYTHPVVWVLRKESAAWRIAGMILRPFPDKPPVVLNYEDMEALVKAKEYIEQESQRRMQAEQPQQQDPTHPLTAGHPGSDPKAGLANGAAANSATTGGTDPRGFAQQAPFTNQGPATGPGSFQQPIPGQQFSTRQPAGQTEFPQTAQRPGAATK